MPFIGNKPTAVPLTSADITDGIITSAKIVDATIATADVANDAITLEKMAGGTDGNIISYDASGNPVAVATGTDGQVLTSTGAGSPPAFEALPAGGVNTPAFEAWQSSNTGFLANNTYVKVQCNTEVFDVGSAYDSTTNYRFTPQTAGKYFIYGNIRGNANGDTRLRNMYAALYINGSGYRESRINFNGERIREANVFVSAIYSFNGSSDYVELYGAVDDSSGSNQGYFTGDSGSKTTNFGAYKIIE